MVILFVTVAIMLLVVLFEIVVPIFRTIKRSKTTIQPLKILVLEANDDVGGKLEETLREQGHDVSYFAGYRVPDLDIRNCRLTDLGVSCAVENLHERIYPFPDGKHCGPLRLEDFQLAFLGVHAWPLVHALVKRKIVVVAIATNGGANFRMRDLGAQMSCERRDVLRFLDNLMKKANQLISSRQ